MSRLTMILAGLAAAKFKGLLFEDPVSLALVGKRWGLELDSKVYDVRSLRDAFGHGYFQVPHTRRDVTATEFSDVLHRGIADMVTVVFSLHTLHTTELCFVLPYDTLTYEVLDLYDDALKRSGD